jgi:hypothetical protein
MVHGHVQLPSVSEQLTDSKRNPPAMKKRKYQIFAEYKRLEANPWN